MFLTVSRWFVPLVTLWSDRGHKIMLYLLLLRHANKCFLIPSLPLPHRPCSPFSSTSFSVNSFPSLSLLIYHQLHPSPTTPSSLFSLLCNPFLSYFFFVYFPPILTRLTRRTRLPPPRLHASPAPERRKAENKNLLFLGVYFFPRAVDGCKASCLVSVIGVNKSRR